MTKQKLGRRARRRIAAARLQGLYDGLGQRTRNTATLRTEAQIDAYLEGWERGRATAADRRRAAYLSVVDPQALNERFERDCAKADSIMDDDSIPEAERPVLADLALLGGTRYEYLLHLSPSGLRTDSDCPPHLRAIPKLGGGYF